MRFSTLATWAGAASLVAATPLNEEKVDKGDTPGFTSGQPIDGNGKGGPILGKTRDVRRDFIN